jgi:hypothetical protein
VEKMKRNDPTEEKKKVDRERIILDEKPTHNKIMWQIFGLKF